MKHYLLKSAVFIVIALSIQGCGKNSSEPTPVVSKLILTTDNSNINTGQSSILTMKLENITEPIFALSLRLTYDNSIISFSDSSGFEAGQYLGSDILSFVRVNNSTIHLSISKLQGQNGSSGSGIVCLLHFYGISSGTSDLQIAIENLHFYDSEGALLDLSNLEIGSARIQVN
jgi:hypothetical protein